MQSLRSRSTVVPVASERFENGTPELVTRRGGPAGALDVLVVEDDDSIRSVCAGLAESLGCRVDTAPSVPEARALIAQRPFDVVFLDLRLPGGSGADLLTEIRVSNPRTLVVIMTAFATVNSAVDLMRNGAGDLLHKPFALDQVVAVLERASTLRQRTQSSRALEDRLQAGLASGRILGHSAAIQKLLRIVAKVATTRHPVLITGERGTGKEVVARAIHANGPFATSPFLPIDCDCLEPSRLELELFGSDITDDGHGRPGLLAAAGDGTVYLSEIGALNMPAQARLLRTLESRQIKTAQGRLLAPLNARILASSSANLESAVAQGIFRKDLFYRLNVVNLRVPPLRERIDDLAVLVESFLENHRQELGVQFRFSDGGWESMLEYEWPGNVSELEAMVAHACAAASDSILHFEDLSTQVRSFAVASVPEAQSTRSDAPVLTLQELEKRAIGEALEQLKGDKVQAARLLGIGKTTLYRKLKEYGLTDDLN